MKVYWKQKYKEKIIPVKIRYPKVDKEEIESEKCMKVITFYAGFRRQWPCEGGPKSSLSLLKYIIEQETKLDYGCNMDFCLVNHTPNEIDWRKDHTLGDGHEYEEFVKYFDSVDGLKTKNGTIITHHKINDCSGSAWNFAYEKYKNDYSYWYFTEDDYVTVKNNVGRVALEILKGNKKIGLVTTYGFWRDKQTKYRIARGFTGMISSKCIEKVFIQNQNKFCIDFAEDDKRFHSNYGFKKYGLEAEERSMSLRLGDEGFQIELLPISKSMVQWKNGFSKDFKNWQVGPILCVRGVTVDWDPSMDRD